MEEKSTSEVKNQLEIKDQPIKDFPQEMRKADKTLRWTHVSFLLDKKIIKCNSCRELNIKNVITLTFYRN
jgi:hypothetical protein